MIRALLLSVLALAAIACNNAKRENIQPPRELEDITTSLNVERLWSRGIGEVGGKPGLRMSVTHADGHLYAANADGDVLTLDAASGREIGRIETPHPFSTTPAVGDGVIAVGTLDGKLVVFDAGSSSERFSVQLTSEVIAAPLIAEGRVFARSHDGRISAYDLTGGSRVWIQEYTVPALSLRGNGELRYDRGYVLAGHDDGMLVALRADNGTAVWQQQVGMGEGRSDLERLADLDGDIAIADGYVYAVGFDGQAMAVDIAGGTPLWARDLSAVGGMAYGDQVFVADAKGHLLALDRASGGALWTQEGLEHRWPSTPAVVGRYVAVGDLEGYVHWLNTNDGSFAAREKVAGDPIRATPLVVGDTIFVMTIDGTLAAYRVGS
jgi:outer membrane protein assembly factor BamB